MTQIPTSATQNLIYHMTRIRNLENVKDGIKDAIVRVSLDPAGKDPRDPTGYVVLDVDVPAAVIREVVEKKIAESHAILNDLGIELIP